MELKDPVTGDILFQHNGSLTKHGITTRLAAEALLDQWAVQYLTGNKPAAAQQQAKLRVRDAVEGYLEYKRSRGKSSESIRKWSDILMPLVPFALNRGIEHLADLDFETLVAFEQTWLGLRVKDPVTGEWSRRPKSLHGKQKYQDVVRMLFRHWHNVGKIPENPAASLEPFSVPKAEIHVYTPEQIQRVFDLIPETFPRTADQVEAFLLVQRYSALRISDVVTLEVSGMEDGEGFRKNQVKTGNGVYCLMPLWVTAKLRAITPRSAKYFFWSGNGEVETAAKDWSGKLLKLFRTAGIPDGYRSHAFRDTMACTILENGGTLEDAQIALGHSSRKTTEKYYTAITKRRAENVNKLKERIWESDPLYRLPSLPVTS